MNLDIKAQTFMTSSPEEVLVTQGEFYVSRDPNVVIKTLLGSCVATCLFDPVAQVGGMNHFLLANGPTANTQSKRYGLYAMEVLINGLLKLGADKQRMEAKLFGGATMSGTMGHIGTQNCDFAISFLELEGLRLSAMSLGGTQARAIRFVPTTGRVSQRLVDDVMLDLAMPRRKKLPSGNIQFFEE